MRRAFLLLFVPLLMGSGPCDDAPASSSPDAAAGSSGAGTTGASGTTGGAGTTGAAGTKGGAGTGGGTSCEDRFEPLANTVALFQGNWILDPGVANGQCGNQYIVSFDPWSFNAADAPQDLSPVPGCSGLFLTLTPKVLEGSACSITAVCPTATAAAGFFVHPYPKNSAAKPSAYGHIIVRGDSMSPWQMTDREAIVDPANPNHMTLDDKFYTRTQIVSGSCVPAP
jgi:hypothetical protein